MMVEILVLLEGALRPYPFFAPLASGPRHPPPIPAEILRTPSSHHIYSRSIVIKISPFHRISPHEGFSDSPVPSVVEILVLLEGALRPRPCHMRKHTGC